jgi:hypothetical protein
MEDELSTIDVKWIENGEPGSNISAFLPINVNHSA